MIASGLLFLLRGTALFTGARWPTAVPLRILSYPSDTVLLTAALMLMILSEVIDPLWKQRRTMHSG